MFEVNNETKFSTSVRVIVGRLSLENPLLIEQMNSLLKSSYIDPTMLLTREERHCNRTYYLSDKNGKLMAFFMVSFEDLFGKPSIYLGLSAVDSSVKNSGLAKLVYHKFIEEALMSQSEIQKDYILYATTATPSAFNTISTLFRNAWPKENGHYSEKAKSIALEYNAKYSVLKSSNPFVLKQVALSTLYSKIEIERINQLILKHSFRLFEKLGINERQGDRLLMIFSLPTASEFETMKQK